MKVRAVISAEGVVSIYVLTQSASLAYHRYLGKLGGRLREIEILTPYLLVETDAGACLWAHDIQQGQQVTRANSVMARKYFWRY